MIMFDRAEPTECCRLDQTGWVRDGGDHGPELCSAHLDRAALPGWQPGGGPTRLRALLDHHSSSNGQFNRSSVLGPLRIPDVWWLSLLSRRTFRLVGLPAGVSDCVHGSTLRRLLRHRDGVGAGTVHIAPPLQTRVSPRSPPPKPMLLGCISDLIAA